MAEPRSQTTTRLAPSAPAPSIASPRRKAAPTRGAASSVHAALREPGTQIEPATRSLLAHRFGRPLDHVRIHDGPTATRAADQAGADAFTVGPDIVFGAGRYQPATPGGVELLAHEVAHTIQQDGAGRNAPQHRLAASTPGSTLEREADAAARYVVSGPAIPGGATNFLHARAGGPLLSRRKVAWAKIPSGPITAAGQAVEDWEQEPSGQALRFKIPELSLPKEKGPVLDAYDAQIKGGGEASGLEATIDLSGDYARAGLKQTRANTPELNRRWLVKVGWDPKEANAKWNAAGGKKGTGFPDSNPGVAKSSCDMDHIVELQLGGTNVVSNIAPLNSAENRKSGRDIWQAASATAKALRQEIPEAAGVANVILSFQKVVQVEKVDKPAQCTPGATDCTCSAVDACAVSQAKTAADAGGGTGTVYQVMAGGQNAQLTVPATATPFVLATEDKNAAGSEVIPGMILEILDRPAGKGHVVTAFIESDKYPKKRSKTRIPVVLKDAQAEVKLDSLPEEGGYRLKLKGKNPTVAFSYPYLSDGFLDLKMGEMGLEGDGKLTPSVPLLRSAVIDVHLGGGAFKGTLKPDKSKLKLPIPGFRVTRADLAVALAPELALTGDLDFEIGKLLTGNLNANATTGGVVLTGGIQAKIPKLESAKGDVVYRNGKLSGSLHIKSDQLANLPGKPEGEVNVGVNADGLTADGHIRLTLPNGKPLDLDAKRADAQHILFTGKTTFALKGLKPVEITVAYDCEHFSGAAKTGVTYKGITGEVAVKYWDGRFSGEAEAMFKAGRLDGSVHLMLDADGSLYGDGRVRAQITKDIAGIIGVKKPKNGEIEVVGELELPKKILLFPAPKPINKTLFDRVFNIPVFGPVAVQINPSVGFGAGIGPATIDDAKVGAGFKPFAEEADFELWAKAQLSIPAYAQLSVGLGLGIALTAGIGSIGGGVNVTGTLRLDGGVFVPFDLHYKAGIFTAKAEIIVKGDLKVLVAVKGYLLAEVGGFELWHPTWDLWDKSFDTGLGFKLIVPLDYASDKAFQLPSRDKMTFEPDISLEAIKRALTNAAGSLA